MSTTSRQKIRWGMARVEFLPLVPEIQKYLGLGWPKKAIYDRLTEQQKISMVYATFSGFIKREIVEAPKPAKKVRKDKVNANDKKTEAMPPEVQPMPETALPPETAEPIEIVETEAPAPQVVTPTVSEVVPAAIVSEPQNPGNAPSTEMTPHKTYSDLF